MNELNKDMIVYIALKTGLPEITALCQTNSKFNNSKMSVPRIVV